METPLLSLDQMSPDLHSFEVLKYGLMLITDKKTGDSFILIPMNPPAYVSKDDVAYLRRFYDDNRAFTPEETKLLQSLAVAPQLLAENSEAVLQWYANVEKVVGPIATKPSAADLKNPLYWNYCAVEVALNTGEVCSYALVNQRAPTLGEGVRRILLKEVAAIRQSPFAVPKEILAVAGAEGTELHMGDALYAAEAGGKYYAIDAYYGFRPEALFFKQGAIKGADLHPTSPGTSNSIIERASTTPGILAFTEPIAYVLVDGLW